MLEHSHEPREIRRRLAAQNQPSYLGDAILGGIDGCVTTVAVVASVAGANLPAMVAFVLGVANMIADAFSMAVSNYQAVKSEEDARERLRLQEERHIEQVPEGERDEVSAIFENKGFSGETLDRIVETITQNRKRWIDTMLQEEFGLALRGRSPARAAFSTFSVFILVGLLPLLPFLVPALTGGGRFAVSAVVACGALFGIGWVKGIVLEMPRGRAGFETLLMGGGAAIVAFMLGYFLEPMIGQLRPG